MVAFNSKTAPVIFLLETSSSDSRAQFVDVVLVFYTADTICVAFIAVPNAQVAISAQTAVECIVTAMRICYPEMCRATYVIYRTSSCIASRQSGKRINVIAVVSCPAGCCLQ